MLPVYPLGRQRRGRAVSPLCVPFSVFPVLCSRRPLDLVDVEMGQRVETP
jgi:hypothetical protein